MAFQPNTAGSNERELIDSMLSRQTEVLAGLDELSLRIEDAIAAISQQRKEEAEAAALLPFGPQRPEADVVTRRAA